MRQLEQWQKFLTAIYTYKSDEPFSANQLATKIGITPATAKSMINIYQIIRNSDAPQISEQQISSRIKIFLIKNLKRGTK